MRQDFSARTKLVIGIGAPVLQLGLLVLAHRTMLTPEEHARLSCGLFAMQAALLFACWGVAEGAVGLLSAGLCILHALADGLGHMRLFALLLGGVAFGAAAVQRRRLDTVAHHHRQMAEDISEEANDVRGRAEAESERVEGLLRRFHKFPVLSRTCEEMGATLEEDEVVDLIVRQSLLLTDNADEAVLFLASEGGHKLEFRASFPPPDAAAAADAAQRPPLDADQFVFQQRRAYVCERTSADIFKLDRLTDGHVASFLSTPLVLDETDAGRPSRRTLGVLRLNSSTPGSFRGEDLEMLTIVSTLAAMSLENAALYQRRRELSITDDLTGLLSQHYFRERFAEELGRATRENSALSCLMMDIDHFKQYNDQFGHPAGDEVLKQFAALLRRTRQRGDIVARYGGEEFSIYTEATHEDAMQLAETLRARVAKSPFGPKGSQQSLTLSVGVSAFPRHGFEVEELIDKADGALYQAKELGRNRVCSA